jgi:hypothetical protein
MAALSLVQCEKDPELVTYPESHPVFDLARVVESTVTYGDSISLDVTLSDEITPLSTLEIQVVLNNEAILVESIRTRDNTSEIHRRYKVPFGPGMSDNVPLKVYLTSINVDGFTTDMIINTTTVQRPVINELWIVPETGTSFKLTLTDPVNLIYHAEGLTFGPEVSYYLATKVNKFFKVDWTGLVFGKIGDGIGLLGPGDLQVPITDSDPTLIGISKFTFDAFNLTTEVDGRLLEPVTTLDINVDLNPMVMASKNFLGNNVFFGKDIEITFTGLTNLANSLPPDYFEVTGANTARFLGNTAIYKASYYIDGNYLYVEPQPDVIHPEALWVCGMGLGRPSTPYEITTSWNWNSPFDYIPCRLVSDGVYQFTAYMVNTDDLNGYGTLDFKYFFKRGWWDEFHEINASEYTVSEPLFGLWVEGKYGNVNGGTTPFTGVYQVTLDENAKTITSVKIN